MNKIVSAVALVALTAVFAFSQENEDKLRFGIRLGFNLNMVSDFDLGMGYGGGVQASIPVVKSPHITFNPEVSFFYRSLYSYEHRGFDYEQELTELAIGIPLVFRYVPTESQPFYVGLGVQLDIPLSPELKTTFNNERLRPPGMEEKIKIDNRGIPDVGLVIEFGYYITKSINADFRYVWGFTDIAKEYKYSLDQIGIGISYLF